MEKEKITGEDLIQAGFKEGKLLGLALETMQSHFEHTGKADVIALFVKLKDYPESFMDDPALQKLAAAMIEDARPIIDDTIPLVAEHRGYSVFGEDYIEEGAKRQMEIAMKLPITIAGALMPDAHHGYGLPIGGVLATNNAIIPYAVGVDIGCRMALTVYDITEDFFLANKSKFQRELIAFTQFGAGAGFRANQRADHEILEREEFDVAPFIRALHDKAYAQLGTSGGGNHFVEWGIIEFDKPDAQLNIDAGRYVALLSHSGSRGLGATIAGHYTKLAKQVCKLPKEAANLAYFDLNSDEGQQYWLAMNLAGDYASACHEVIHERITRAIGGQVLARVENHHNFAWKEQVEGADLMVHRKGATPAGKDVLGIIPGSMTAPGFLVRGKGNRASINSASHGAGRQMSRTKAIENISRAQMKSVLAEHNVTLIGAGLDEAPMAYKDIHKVMAAQQELVDIIGKFTPQIVRMAEDGSQEG